MPSLTTKEMLAAVSQEAAAVIPNRKLRTKLLDALYERGRSLWESPHANTPAMFFFGKENINALPMFPQDSPLMPPRGARCDDMGTRKVRGKHDARSFLMKINQRTLLMCVQTKGMYECALHYNGETVRPVTLRQAKEIVEEFLMESNRAINGIVERTADQEEEYLKNVDKVVALFEGASQEALDIRRLLENRPWPAEAFYLESAWRASPPPSAARVAQTWAEEGFDAEHAEAWLQAGCYDPAKAARLHNLGVWPSQGRLPVKSGSAETIASAFFHGRIGEARAMSRARAAVVEAGIEFLPRYVILKRDGGAMRFANFHLVDRQTLAEGVGAYKGWKEIAQSNKSQDLLPRCRQLNREHRPAKKSAASKLSRRSTDVKAYLPSVHGGVPSESTQTL